MIVGRDEESVVWNEKSSNKAMDYDELTNHMITEPRFDAMC